MKKAIVPMLICALLLSLGGCTYNQAGPSAKEVEIKLFYASEGNEKIVVETRKISAVPGSDIYVHALEELFRGPAQKTLTVNIPKGTGVYGVIRQKDALIVDLSGFTGFGGSIAELLAVGSIVNTLTQFEGIQRVKILVEGEELIGPSGEPTGFMTEFPLEP